MPSASPLRNLRRLVRRLGPERAAERLDVRPSTLARWIAEGVPERRSRSVETAVAFSDRAARAAETRASKRSEVRQLLADVGAKPKKLKQLAERLDVRPSTLERWAEEGAPPSRRVDVAEAFRAHRAAQQAAETRASRRHEVGQLVEQLGADRAAKELGVSPSTLARWRTHGAPKRRRRDVEEALEQAQARELERQQAEEQRRREREAAEQAAREEKQRQAEAAERAISHRQALTLAREEAEAKGYSVERIVVTTKDPQPVNINEPDFIDEETGKPGLTLQTVERDGKTVRIAYGVREKATGKIVAVKWTTRGGFVGLKMARAGQHIDGYEGLVDHPEKDLEGKPTGATEESDFEMVLFW